MIKKKTFFIVLNFFILSSCGQKATTIPTGAIILRDDIDIASHNAKKCFIKGLDYYEAKKYHAAKVLFLKADSICPNNPIILNSLGNLFNETYDDTLSESYYKRALQIDSNFIQTYINYGAYLNNKSHYEEAKNLFCIALKKKVKAKIDKQLLYINLAESYDLMNQKEIAVYYLENAIETLPNSFLCNKIIDYQKQLKVELSKQKVPNF